MKTCVNCGNSMGIHGCTWCNEESYIYDQYLELDMPGPSREFCDKVKEQKRKEKQRKRHEGDSH